MSVLDLLIGTRFREHAKVAMDTLGKTEDTVVSFTLGEYLDYAEGLVQLSLLEDGMDAGTERDSLFTTTMLWFILNGRDDVPEKIEEVKKALMKNGRYKFDADDEEEDDGKDKFSASDIVSMFCDILGLDEDQEIKCKFSAKSHDGKDVSKNN